ncbi:MAG TPA: hypothetical protein VF708_04905 [Pyrinomonadaceae bacterium]|jgi:hypothetical protein
MAYRRRTIPTVIAAALIALCLPLLASAQSNYDPWDYGHDKAHHRGLDGDHRYDASDRYNRERLRDSVRRVKERSKEFERHLDRGLDQSRHDGDPLEDHVNEEARKFREAASDLKDKLGDARNFNHSANEARKLLQLGAHLDRFMSRSRLGRAQSDWTQIRQDLGIIADVYGFRMTDFDQGYYRRDDDTNRRNEGYYRRSSSNYPGASTNQYITWGQSPF